ncbi:FKBP-type peptidyl-prolyl cis-trans isomerase [Streptomyces californicus]
MLPTKVADALAGHKVGSRVQVEGIAAEAIVGEQLNPQSGIKPTDPLVWVVDIVNAKKVDKKGEAKGEQAASEAGMPEELEAASQKAATITVPKGAKAPKDLKEQVLIKGDGAEVKAGEGLVVQYTGVKWEDGKKFDSSGPRRRSAFPIGVGGVIQGWDKGLVGKHVGDRVLLTIPPNQAYGADPSNQLAKNNLVFVVDILGTV